MILTVLGTAPQPGPDAAAILSLRQFMEASESGELSDYGRMADDDPLRPRRRDRARAALLASLTASS